MLKKCFQRMLIKNALYQKYILKIITKIESFLNFNCVKFLNKEWKTFSHSSISHDLNPLIIKVMTNVIIGFIFSFIAAWVYSKNKKNFAAFYDMQVFFWSAVEFNKIFFWIVLNQILDKNVCINLAKFRVRIQKFHV